MKKLIIYLFTVLFFTLNIYLTLLSAEEKPIEQQQTKSKNNTVIKPTPKISSRKRSEIKTLEEFIPSEEISADKPISFPTDI